jgi:flavin-dependent dehydrogenase
VNEQRTKREAPAAPKPEGEHPDSQSERIAIIGGGIAGLFCAYVLAEDGHTVDLFESSKVLGGRIRSFRFNDKLLNRIEREDDKARQPVKDEAILKDALVPKGLIPAG